MKSKYNDSKRKDEEELKKLIGILDRRVDELNGKIEDKDKELAVKKAMLTVREGIVRDMSREVQKMSEGALDTKLVRIKMKEGIVKQESKPGKMGRPKITESKNDPDLAIKATELRSRNLSWSEIASNLGVGRTTARRLVNLCQKDE